MARRTPPRYKSGPKKGQFKPRSARKSTRKRKSATTRGKSKPMARRRKRRSSPKRRRSAGGPSFKKQAQDLMIGGAAYGFISESSSTATLMTQVAKVPTIGNRDITNGVVLYFLNKHVVKNKYVKSMALAALVTGATKFGQNNFSLSGGGLDDALGWDEAIDVTEEGESVSGIMDMDE